MKENAKNNNITLSDEINDKTIASQKRLLAERNVRFATLQVPVKNSTMEEVLKLQELIDKAEMNSVDAKQTEEAKSKLKRMQANIDAMKVQELLQEQPDRGDQPEEFLNPAAAAKNAPAKKKKKEPKLA